MLKKSILIVCCDMGKGGVSKSLASLLECVDYDAYDIDLFLFEKKGLFLEKIPKEVNILPENQSLKYFLKKGKVFAVLKAFMTAQLNLNENKLEKKWSRFWKSYKNLYQKNDKAYDVAISYNDGVELYYIVDCINAKTKIGYNHSAYTNKLTYKPNLDRPYYNKLNYIVTVSEICAKQLKKVFPENADKVRVIENIVKKESVEKMAGQEDPYICMVKNRGDTKIIVTVAGLYLRKGFDLAAEALEGLKKEGYNFQWFIIGVGPEEAQIKEIIENNNIQEETVFLYEQSNPYKYVKWSDIFMLTSYAEGKSIAVEEAKLLEKPILITCFSSATDQIEHGKNGLIAKLDSGSIKKELRKLLDSAQLRNQLSLYLRANYKSNVEENLNKVYELWK